MNNQVRFIQILVIVMLVISIMSIFVYAQDQSDFNITKEQAIQIGRDNGLVEPIEAKMMECAEGYPETYTENCTWRVWSLYCSHGDVELFYIHADSGEILDNKTCVDVTKLELEQAMEQAGPEDEIPIELIIKKNCIRIEYYKQLDHREPPQKAIELNCTNTTPIETILEDLESLNITLKDYQIEKMGSSKNAGLVGLLPITKGQINGLYEFGWVERIYYSPPLSLQESGYAQPILLFVIIIAIILSSLFLWKKVIKR